MAILYSQVIILSLLCLIEMTVAEDYFAEKHMTIGVIAEGSKPDNRTTFWKSDYNVTVIWSFIDITEVYKIFAAVHKFDNNQNVDVIMLFDYDPRTIPTLQVLQTRHKQVIKLGRRKALNFNIAKEGATVKGFEISNHVQEPYCRTNLNASIKPFEKTDMPSSLTIGSMVQLLHILLWNSVILIHDNTTARELRELTDALSEDGVMFAIFNIDLVGDFHATLSHIYDTNMRLKPEMNFVVLCRPACAINILRVANQFDVENTLHVQATLLRQFSKWLVAVYGHTAKVSRNIHACAADLDNVAIIAIPEGQEPTTSDLPDILDTVLTDSYHEALANTSNNTRNATVSKEYMVEKLIKEVLTWNPVSRCHGYNIDTLLWTIRGRGFSSVGYIGIEGNIALKSELFPNTKLGYNKRKFVVSTLEWNPFVLRIKQNVTDNVTGEVIDRVTVGYEGFTIDLLKELARVLNFTYELVEPPDQKWGGLVIEKNNTFNGLIGQIQRQFEAIPEPSYPASDMTPNCLKMKTAMDIQVECDMVAAPLSIQANRDKVVDFSYPYYLEYTTVIVKKPDPQILKWRTLIDPFKGEVLVAIGIALGIVTVLIFLLEKNNPFYATPEHGEDRSRTGGLHYLHDSFWYMYGCLLNQGGVHLPDSTAGRTFVSCWWLTCIAVVGIYSGNLIAFLTVTKEKAPFNTLAEMVETQGIKWGTMGSTSWTTAFFTSSLPTFIKVAEGLRKFNKTDPGVLDQRLDYHLDRVREGGYAWIGDKTAIEYATSSQCGLIKIKDEFLPLNYALVFPENSPHTFMFSEQIMKLHESGLLQIWKRKWWPKSNFCAGDQVPQATPILLIDVQSAFYVCVLGTFIGAVAFAAEHIMFRHGKCKNRNPDGKMVHCVSEHGIKDDQETESL